MLIAILYVGLGSFLGGVLRYLGFCFLPLSPLYNLLFINVLGSFCIGALSQILLSNDWRLFFFVGFLGSFTTLSTLSFEVFSLLQNSRYLLALTYALGSLAISVCAVGVGMWVGKCGI